MQDLKLRKEQIENLYKSVLQRDADDGGLKHYMESSLSLEEIEEAFKNSLEYAQLKRKKDFKSDVESLGQKELLVMGSTPRKQEHLNMLSNSDIGAILCLDEKITYPNTWCKSFLHVPIEKDKPIPVDKLTQCIEFLFECMAKNNIKTFVHSWNGVERAPLMLALFIASTQEISLQKALNIVRLKRREINPSRSLVDAKLLEKVYELRKTFTLPQYKEQDTPKVKTTPTSMGNSVVVVSDNMFLGASVNSSVLEDLKNKGVKTIIDLNEKSLKIDSPIGSWFAQVKLPVPDKQLKNMMPILIRTSRKFMGRGPVYMVCSNPAVLFMFVDTYAANIEKSDVIGSINIENIRKALMP